MRLKLLILLSGVFLMSSCLVEAQADLDSIKAKAAASVRAHRDEQTTQTEPMTVVLSDQSQENQAAEQIVTSSRVLWSVWDGRVKFWQLDGQYYLHLGG